MKERSANRLGSGRERGFSLLELMIVIAIAAVLAVQVYSSMNSAFTTVRGQMASLRSDINLARLEAVNRNENVLVEFYFIGYTDDDGVTWTTDGYRICVDSDVPPDSNCDAADVMIREVHFNPDVTFFNLGVVPDGPTVNATAAGGAWVAGDGITLGADRISARADGTFDKAGAVYIYSPDGNGGILGGPMAMVILTSGRLRVVRWSKISSQWQTR